jgi:iron complex outermembrane receptor protein
MKRSWDAFGVQLFCVFALIAGTGAPQLLLAADDTGPAKGDTLETVEVSADKLHVLPTEPIESVFGFGKNIVETPRALTSISNEMLDRVNITDINDLVALSPGAFTQSFFGVAGSLDIRGSAGENYFRGIRRIDNPGNYPQAIGASDRIDIVRGPASPIYGPSKVGGYLNFVPKSARADSGAYLTEATGEIGVTTGRWDEKTLHAEVGGPSTLFGVPSGYYVYSQFENSGSYYENTSTRQSIFQASYNMDFNDHLRTEAGGMYQDFAGNQVAGWNRLTQSLINNGTYITGSPSNLDTNHNGLLDVAEAEAAGIGTDANFIFNPPGQTPASIRAALTSNPNLALLNPGIGHLSGNQVLVAPGDKLTDGVTTLYFDMIYEPSEGMKLTNKSFYEDMNNLNENAYGFSQVAHTWAFEDQLTLTYSTTFAGFIKSNFQLGPQIRHQDFETGDDFAGEFFDRRDLTQPSSVIDSRSLATRGQSLYSDHAKGSYTDSAFAYLMDVTFFDKLNLLGGGRYDMFHVTSHSLNDSLTDPGLQARDNIGKVSWSGSVSYQLPFGLRPYVTIARQSTLTAGEGGQIEPGLVASHSSVAGSRLNEYGLKGSFLDGQLYAAVDYFDQKRVDFNAQDEVSNNSTRAKGYEFETRWVVNRSVTLTGAYTNMKVINITAEQGGQFAFVGGGDLQGVDPSLMYGGAVGAVFLAPTDDAARKAGIPQNLFSINGIFSLDEIAGERVHGTLKGVTASVGVTHVDSTWSGFSKTITLPAYTLLNAGLHFENAKWKVGLEGKNLTNARYFRSNFPDLFGGSVVLPELPRNWMLQLGRKF